MTIKQATEAANAQQKGITREAWMPNPIFLIPTNTDSGVIVISPDRHQSPGQRWEPRSEDLMADDWTVYG